MGVHSQVLTGLTPPPQCTRLYRLVDPQGDPHPVLDGLYDSQEAAWTDAVAWWEMQDSSDQAPMAIGVEVSTSNGGWRTIRPPGT
ncbi:MAG: hypothetical protein ACKOOC_01980 [Cyanobium sp.]